MRYDLLKEAKPEPITLSSEFSVGIKEPRNPSAGEERGEKKIGKMIHRKWSLLTGPVAILGSIVGSIIVANYIFIENVSLFSFLFLFPPLSRSFLVMLHIGEQSIRFTSLMILAVFYSFF